MIVDPKILTKCKRLDQRYSWWMFAVVDELATEYLTTRDHLPTPPAKGRWRKATPGTVWGGAWMTTWFRARLRRPRSAGDEGIWLRADTGAPEAMLLVDGQCRGVFDKFHPFVSLGPVEGACRIAVEAYAGHPHIGNHPDDDRHDDFRRTFRALQVCVRREQVAGFVFDLRTLLQLAEMLDEHSLRRGQILAGLSEVYRLLPQMPAERPVDEWLPRLAEARKVMAELLSTPNGPCAPRYGLVGHSHIDTAWLWPTAETHRKCARTFSSVLNLMGQYPEMTFVQSAPYHADVVRRQRPELFERVREAVRAGRWEPNGAMWVEPDCNIPAGESLVRQLLFGQRFTRQHFGYTADAFWQPDVFGYSAALPQLLRSAGVEFFLTTKMAWNDTTRFPYDTFWWTGLDGTRVLAHFFKIHATPQPTDLIRHWRDIQHKDVQDRRLQTFGWGDGGGGPTFEMLEMARRCRDLDGCPRAEMTTVSRFMRELQDESPHLPEWVGELYLELHRGTLTSIAGIKRGNRKLELALRDAEWLSTAAALRGAAYPSLELGELWQTLLVNQFHDILPGSSIPEVNDQAIEELNRSIDAAERLADRAMSRLTGRRPATPRAAVVFNSLSWERGGEWSVEGVPAGLEVGGEGVVCQCVENPAGSVRLAVHGITLPPLGAARVELREVEAGEIESPFRLRGRTLTTPFARVRFDRHGRIVSLLDRESGREVVQPGGALNTFWLGEDIPLSYDNWDIDFDHELKLQPQLERTSFEVVADGPLQLRLRSEYAIGDDSRLFQDMVFHSTTPRIDFETVVDWRERHRLLKVGFPVDVLCETARHEMQFGHVERPTHRNRPADKAQFEVCNHRWTDVSENGFGVALLNDCKYGIGVHRGQMRLTLLKSGTHPDRRGDAGRHLFTYSLLPHAGGFSVESVVQPAHELNEPPRLRPVSAKTEALSPLVTVSQPHVLVDAVKWSEDGDGFILRLYEAGKTGAWCELEFGISVSEVEETNILEETLTSVKTKGGKVRLYFRPFEVETLRVRA